MTLKIEMQGNYVLRQKVDPAAQKDLLLVYANIDDYIKRFGVENNYTEVIAFVVGQPDVDDMQCLHFENPFWVTYFSERGKRLDASLFININDSLSFLLSKVYNIARGVISYEGWP